MMERELPESHVIEVDDGFISRPDQVGEVVRRLTDRATVEPA